MLASYDPTTGLCTLVFRLYGHDADGEPDPRRQVTGSSKNISVMERVQNQSLGDGPLADPIADPVTGYPIKFSVSAYCHNPEYVKPEPVGGLGALSSSELANLKKQVTESAVAAIQTPPRQPLGMYQLPQPVALPDGTILPPGINLPMSLVAKLMSGMA